MSFFEELEFFLYIQIFSSLESQKPLKEKKVSSNLRNNS